ncbi:MAG TPA: VWA domain-containing protein [Phycisphaerales bacterium]|nr:VWA domain-containing protein [Phycisphaerales bacterium]
MTFLAPLPAVIAGAIAIPALLALYMLRLRRRPVRVGSILFWPGAEQDLQANVPLRRLRPSWLLFLHLLALLLVLLAFARPAVDTLGAGAERVVLLIDASASMSARDPAQPGAPTRLDRAKERAGELAREMLRGAGRRRVAVVAFAHSARAATGFTSSSAIIDDAIASIEPTDQPGDLARALEAAEALALSADAAEEEPDPALVLLSDGSFRTTTRAPASALRTAFERIGDDAAPFNAGVVAIGARRDAATPSSLARLSVRIAANAPGGVDVAIAVAVDGVVRDRRAVPIPARAEDRSPADAEVPLAVPVTNAQTVLTVSISGGDALSADDTASVVIPPLDPPAIAVVRDPSAAATAWLLDDVLAELRPRSLATGAPTQPLPAETDLVVADGAWPAPHGEPPRHPSTLAFGVVPDVPGVAAAGVATPRAGSVFWDRRHPVMRGVSLDDLVIARSLHLTLADPPPPGWTFTVVARSDDTPLIVEARSRTRAVLVAGFALAETNWPLRPSFPVFIANAVDFLTGRDEGTAGRAHRTDELIPLDVPPDVPVSVRGPVTVELPPAAGDAGRSVGPLPRAGVYTVRGGGGGVRALAVNLCDQTETALASPGQVRVGGVALRRTEPVRTPREVWRWFILAAVGVLTVEWVVYAWRSRV